MKQLKIIHKKFPERFTFKLNDNESKIFSVEIFDQKIETRGGKYKNPRVFVSCEEKATKASGVLFKKVEEKIKRKIDKHIGDNYAADILGAQKAGIKEVEFVGPPIYSKKVKTPVLKNPKLRKLIIDKELSNSSIEEKIGYLFGPIILLFLKTLLLEVSTSQTVFFNARDSFILYVIARWILKTDKKMQARATFDDFIINYPDMLITNDIRLLLNRI